MSAFDRLPYLRPGTTVHQASSYDRTGLNNDGSSYFHYWNSETGGYVVLEAHHPGTIYRIWATALVAGNIRIYFDGESAPRVDLPVDQFFSGTRAPFLAPLVGNEMVSSGGFYSYYPFSFRESVRVEFTNMPRFYNITYHLYNTTDGVTTYTGEEDLAAARNAWMNPSVDPKRQRNNHTESIAPFDLPPGQTTTLLDLREPGSINQFVLRFPQFFTTQYVGRGEQLQDNGRSHQGTSGFTVAIAPNNQGVVLERRMDYYVAHQTADVYVDGRLAGRWFDRGSDWLNRWRDVRFMIPAQFTQGRSSIRVEIRFIGSAYDWNEYYYWVRSVMPDTQTPRLTDTLDVGDPISESSHNYTITNPGFNGAPTFTYLPAFHTQYDPPTLDVLGKARIRIYWDGEAQPGVDVPLGFLFGVGAGGEGSTRGLLAGVVPETHTYYNYFPMPFRRSARVQLVNDSSTPIQGAQGQFAYNLVSSTVPVPGVDAGYFTAIYSREDPTVVGRDFHFGTLASGAGHIVGVVQNIRSDSVWGLEGDERIFIDDFDANPRVHGTGTEDYYNGGWYFANGILSLPVHGAPLVHWYTEPANHTMYRWSIADAFVFESGVKFKIEHGGYNDHPSLYESALFAYVAPGSPTLRQTDTLRVGDPNSEQQHNYVITNPTWQGTVSHTYVGRDDGRRFSGTGRAHTGSSEFTLSVEPNNYGVRLARILDFNSANQKANIYVDGQPAGVWLTPGTNSDHRASLDFFEIPPRLTANKQSIRVRVEFVSASDHWTEFTYTAYSHIFASTAMSTPGPQQATRP
ncbi:MAG TPA: DUF2961 domain-containing protein [Chloroflexia bacterium]|nr:DUF2961 domain-containing protein [Chloroflexia bacterium]